MESDKIFAGPIPEVYEKYLVPLIFASYAADLAGRLRTGRVSCILEIAAGTGVLTRALDAELSEEIEIVATDIMPRCSLTPRSSGRNVPFSGEKRTRCGSLSRMPRSTPSSVSSA